MSLPAAYCVQVDDVINIDQAHNYYFAQPEPRADLTFLCPDERCREIQRQVVTGVNYNKVEFVQEPHFRLTNPENHLPECPWVDVANAVDEIDIECPAGRRLGKLKRSEIIDLFDPFYLDEDIPRIDLDHIEKVAILPTRRARIDAYKTYLLNTPNSTSVLDRVANCFKAMSESELKQTSLSIAGLGESTYRRYFTSAEFCRPSVCAEKIYYGPAKVIQNDGGFALTFSKSSKLKNDDNVAIVAVNLFVPNEMYEHYRRGGAVLATLLTASELDGYPIFCCAFGPVSVADTNGIQQLNIGIQNLNSLSIKLI